MHPTHHILLWNDTNYSSWLNVLPTSLISISSVSLIFVTTSTVILTSVPVHIKSLCGGMVSPSPLYSNSCVGQNYTNTE